ncbi:MAG TPA: hypothetical protein VKS23_06980 [Thermoanaerobaculia bacterium]|nr:hypothetical protein [Thermoanaerobaculia bacterium]
MTASRAGRSAFPLYAFLTILVWGLFASDRGLFQDDASLLAWAQSHAHEPLRGLFATAGSPTRRLLGLPYILAYATPAPVLVLQALYGVSWLLLGVALHALTLALFPGRRGLALLSGALVLTATSDLLTNSLVALGYNLSALAFLAALLFAVRWVNGGGLRWLLLAGLLVNASVFTADGAVPAIALAPLLFWAARGRLDRRVLLASGFWAGVLVPYLALFLKFLLDPKSYASVAFVPLEPLDRAWNAFALVSNNFLPWQWVFDRPVWGDVPPTVIPGWILAAAALAGTLAFVRAGRAIEEPGDGPTAGGTRRELAVLGVALLMVVATNAAFAGVQFAEVFYRTHVVSRIPASLAVALAATVLARRLRRPALALALPAVFVGLGVAGGIERQDFYLSEWRRHRRELRSLLDDTPRLVPGTEVVLFMDRAVPAFQATKAPYLAASWANLLWGPAVVNHAFLWFAEQGTGCRPQDAGLVCWSSSQEHDAMALGASTGTVMPWGKLLLFYFAPEDGRYRVAASFDGSRPGYDPAGRVAEGPPIPLVEHLLAGDRLLGKLLPEGPVDRR